MIPTSIPDEPGTYALVLENRQAGPLSVGRLGTLNLEPGVYVYVGSAFGSGGLAARIRHHANLAARPHWHIDYLRAACRLAEVWFTTDPARREHAWAGAVARLPGAGRPMPRFGSSDCDCVTHLLWFERRPPESALRRALQGAGSKPPNVASFQTPRDGGHGGRRLPKLPSVDADRCTEPT